jgi:2-polyprenyl-3-methyl-5-hydroxy-6-metoxy-1,4-benzoquinol methylase
LLWKRLGRSGMPGGGPAPRVEHIGKYDWSRPYDTLRRKWIEVPLDVNGERIKTSELLRLPDQELLKVWSTARDKDGQGPGFAVRGWYRTLYADFVRGKRLIDVGSGLGFDSITFAQYGANVTFVDLAQTNLLVLQRLCDLLGVRERTTFLYMEDVSSLEALPRDFDVVLAVGSLHNAPFEVMKPEVLEIVRHLKLGGRWLQLAYPKTRWIREGALPFDEWGERTDGAGTPWEEWYDVPKLLELLTPAKFDLVFYCEFHNADFNWFDLILRGWTEGDGREGVAGRG